MILQTWVSTPCVCFRCGYFKGISNLRWLNITYLYSLQGTGQILESCLAILRNSLKAEVQTQKDKNCICQNSDFISVRVYGKDKKERREKRKKSLSKWSATPSHHLLISLLSYLFSFSSPLSTLCALTTLSPCPIHTWCQVSQTTKTPHLSSSNLQPQNAQLEDIDSPSSSTSHSSWCSCSSGCQPTDHSHRCQNALVLSWMIQQ